MSASTDFRVLDVEDIGPHYATTLARWRENFLARLNDVRALGYSDVFVRMWEFYLCYCEAASRSARSATSRCCSRAIALAGVATGIESVNAAAD